MSHANVKRQLVNAGIAEATASQAAAIITGGFYPADSLPYFGDWTGELAGDFIKLCALHGDEGALKVLSEKVVR